jgi:hypothetical protein
MASNQKAELIARAAVEHASSILYKNIPQPLPPGQTPAANNWSVAPGMLFVGNTSIPLSSGDSTSSSDPDLNQVDSGGNPEIGAGTQIKVAWVNVFADPSQAANGTVQLANGTYNQIVGRYAFWMDDENSKINLNTAYGKPTTQGGYFANLSGVGLNSYIYGVPSFNIPIGTNPRFPNSTNPYSLGHPSSVSLDSSLFGAATLDRDTLWYDRLNRSIASAAEVTNYASTGSTFFQQNKFWLTHVNADPEFNAFGKARIFFTDAAFQPSSKSAQLIFPGSDGFTFVPEVSSTTGSFRDSAEPLTFHVDANISTVGQDTPAQNSAVAAVQQIASYLNLRWSGYQHSFVEKWSVNQTTADTQGKREAQQVAWNMFAMAATATNTTMNGIWANQIRAAGSTTASWSTYLWNGPQLDASWPSSRILPETRAARVPRFAISFIATQRTKANHSGTLVSGLSGTTNYVVNVRLWPQYSLPRGLQGFEQLTEPWNPGTNNDQIYITHLEATIDDGSSPGGASARRVIWSSEAQSDPSLSGLPCLYWDSNGRTNLYHLPGYPTVLAPDGLNYGFVASSTGFNPASQPWTLSTSDATAAGVSPARSISVIFHSVTGGTNHPCSISNVRLRFVVTAGAGSNAAPTQISPMRDIDGAPGFDVSHTQDSTVTDSGAILFPGTFTIPTTAITSNAPEYWVGMETLDARVNGRGTPATGSTISDDWQQWTTAFPLAGPLNSMPAVLAEGSRNTRFTTSYPQSGTNGDESKCAWIDTSPYAQRNPSAQQRLIWGNTPGDINSRMPSVGLLSCISTGIQTGLPWRTIKLQPTTTEDPPDWLLLDLFAIPFNGINNIGTVPDTVPVPLTLMNSTAGKININAAVFPNSTTPTTALRSAPIKALLLNAYRPNVVSATSTLVNATTATTLYNNIASYLNNTKASHHFDYAGEICQVPGISDTASGGSEWEREALARQLASLITTRSNVFSVWGVAQIIKKNPANNNPANLGIFETKAGGAAADDLITGEKRFHAIIQRYVWPGVDGTLGNGQTTSGTYSQLGSTASLGSTTNVIDATDPTTSAFYQAYNPGAAVMKYRVVYFEYLN